MYLKYNIGQYYVLCLFEWITWSEILLSLIKNVKDTSLPASVCIRFTLNMLDKLQKSKIFFSFCVFMAENCTFYKNVWMTLCRMFYFTFKCPQDFFPSVNFVSRPETAESYLCNSPSFLILLYRFATVTLRTVVSKPTVDMGLASLFILFIYLLLFSLLLFSSRKFA